MKNDLLSLREFLKEITTLYLYHKKYGDMFEVSFTGRRIIVLCRADLIENINAGIFNIKIAKCYEFSPVNPPDGKSVINHLGIVVFFILLLLFYFIFFM
jgi:hypothetical protein